ncbi:Pre-mRNA-splicing factor SPF27 [Tetrabaena socialis]|uniref:Pre-mRNA-splicing factor SPF27 n=1 Tax=Tetrabaena socialis TaxID=47790 RepID=A0A2J7ZNI3_9CHLO|nr:Pre-mRNA-splicing factor SPF27 [Tetrabaena socialis]|eukprot:PNH01810.1 Pre-mRNA-splicing factor SPF27 [Tetrabaena socialis]
MAAQQQQRPLALDYAAHGAAKGWRLNENLIDALPYVDHVPVELKPHVDALVEEEKRRSTKMPSDYLRELQPVRAPQFDEHPVLKTEYERCVTPHGVIGTACDWCLGPRTGPVQQQRPHRPGPGPGALASGAATWGDAADWATWGDGARRGRREAGPAAEGEAAASAGEAAPMAAEAAPTAGGDVEMAAAEEAAAAPAAGEAAAPAAGEAAAALAAGEALGAEANGTHAPMEADANGDS